MVLNTKRIHNSFWRNVLERAKRMPSKVLFVGKKRDGRSIIARQNCNEIVGNSKNELKIIILVLNYLTILLEYTKTIIHLSVGG